MPRRSTPQHVIDDAAFPIRVKIEVPSGGLGQALSHAYDWLNREVGPGQYAQHSAAALGGSAAAFHFRDVEAARRFLEAFPGFVLADQTRSAVYTSPMRPFAGES